jgi:hypothetical protein
LSMLPVPNVTRPFEPRKNSVRGVMHMSPEKPPKANSGGLSEAGA